MTTDYQLTAGAFSGPLDKLLELIEEKKLAITDISLAQVTDDFLRYLEAFRKAPVSEGEMELLADFVVVASRLLFIKSKSLLPDMVLSDEDESDVRDLTTRLAFYKEFRPAMKLLLGLWQGSRASFARPYFLTIGSAREGAYYPGSLRSAEELKVSMAKLFEGFEKFTIERQVVRERVVTLEEKLKEIRAAVERLKEIVFSEFTKASPRSEIIVTFLAILHLAREQLIRLEQPEGVSDILITKHG